MAGFSFSLGIVLATAVAAADKPAVPRVAEDLGLPSIDVSSYPEEYQKTYQDIFVPVFKFHGGTARAVNSPIIELDAHLEQQEQRNNPMLFSDPEVAQVSRDGWKKFVQSLYRTPACCGACPVMTLEKARSLWRFLAYDSIQRKTGRRAPSWALYRKDLMRRFREEPRVLQETGK
jgi:hypothetical protein